MSNDLKSRGDGAVSYVCNKCKRLLKSNKFNFHTCQCDEGSPEIGLKQHKGLAGAYFVCPECETTTAIQCLQFGEGEHWIVWASHCNTTYWDVG